jgi:hypothetical protein
MVKRVSDFIRQGLNSLLHGHDELTRARLQQDQAVQGLREELAATRRQLRELQGVVAGHRERIDLLSRELTQRRDELVTKDYMVHQEIAKGLDVLVQQTLVHAAIQSNPADERGIALVVARLSQLFDDRFDDLDVDAGRALLLEHDVELGHSMVSAVLRGVHELKQLARDSGHEHRWLLEAQAGVALDETFQRPWPQCDPAGLVELAVAPAYVVQDEVYSCQLVYTGPPPVEDRPEPTGRRRSAR